MRTRATTRLAGLLLVASAALAIWLPASALAAPHTLYVTHYEAAGSVSRFNIGTGGELTADGGSAAAGAYADLTAFSPNGKYAYVTYSGTGPGGGGISEYDVGAGGALVPMATPGVSVPGAYVIAVSPDGRHVYVTGSTEVAVFNVGPNGQLSPDPAQPTIPDTSTPQAVAVSPDGKSLYVANYFGKVGGGSGSGDVAQFNLAADGAATPKSTPAVTTGAGPQYIALTPNGKFAYISNITDATVSQYSIGTGGGLSPIGTPASAGATGAAYLYTLRVSPDGKSVYVPNLTGVYQFSVQPNGTLTPKSPSSVADGTAIDDLWFTPDGRSAYVPDYNAGNAGNVFEFNASSAGVLSPKPTASIAGGEGPGGVMIAPDQAPVASFTASPASPGSGSRFNGSSSRDPDGTVARYDWTFGDGASASNGGPTPVHSYAKAGRYTVTLTVTDDSGCSTHQVFTGQSMYCNGGPSATISRTVTVSPLRPKLSALHVTPHRFSIAGRRIKGRCVKQTRGNKGHRSCTRAVRLKVSYRLNVRDRVTITIKRQLSGRKVRGRCVKTTRKNHRHSACTLRMAVHGKIVRTSHSGTTRLTFGGKIGGHRLGPGTYRLTATPKSGKSSSVIFKIVR